jgi:hypothetical protein
MIGQPRAVEMPDNVKHRISFAGVDVARGKKRVVSLCRCMEEPQRGQPGRFKAKMI